MVRTRTPPAPVLPMPGTTHPAARPRRGPTRRATLAAMLAMSLAGGCTVSQDQEVQIGRQNAEQVNAQLPIVEDPAIAGYVQELGSSIAKTTSRADLDWRFFVVDSREVNAFALPGGFIYINRGLIERASRLDELAGAIGHEIGHVVRRHSVQQMEKKTGANVAVGLACTLTNICNSGLGQAAIQVGGAALFAKYSRHDEAEADSEAVVNVVRAGIDPEGIPALFNALIEERRRAPARIEVFFASHPMEESRVRATEAEIASLPAESLRGLMRDQDGYHAFQDRLRARPAPRDPRADQRLTTEQLRDVQRTAP